MIVVHYTDTSLRQLLLYNQYSQREIIIIIFSPTSTIFSPLDIGQKCRVVLTLSVLFPRPGGHLSGQSKSLSLVCSHRCSSHQRNRGDPLTTIAKYFPDTSVRAQWPAEAA